MKLKRTDGKRKLVVEHLERRELLAADLSCPMVMLPQGPGGDDAAIVQNQVSIVADGRADTVLQRREQSEANSGIGALQRPRDRDSQDSATELTFLATASVPTDDPPEEQVRTDEDRDSANDLARQKRPRDRDSDDSATELTFLAAASVPTDDLPEEQVRTDEDRDSANDLARQKRPRDRDSQDDTVTSSTLLEGSAVDAAFQADALAASGNGGTQENPANSLSEDEILNLLFIREEEKLARDVYITLGEQWGLPIFTNIAASEQQHMDAIGQLIDKYGLEDPIINDDVGKFSNPILQQLYDDLVSDKLDIELVGVDLVIDGGAVSLSAALRVGAFIEEYDILDIQHALAATDHSDIENVYGNLLRGSRNHLRSFVGQIEAIGETYDPVLMTVAEYDAIIDADQETANGNGRGGQRSGGRRS